MNWTGRIIAIVLTIVFAGFLANLISKLVVQGLHTWTGWITNVLSGSAGWKENGYIGRVFDCYHITNQVYHETKWVGHDLKWVPAHLSLLNIVKG